MRVILVSFAVVAAAVFAIDRYQESLAYFDRSETYSRVRNFVFPGSGRPGFLVEEERKLAQEDFAKHLQALQESEDGLEAESTERLGNVQAVMERLMEIARRIEQEGREGVATLAEQEELSRGRREKLQGIETSYSHYREITVGARVDETGRVQFDGTEKDRRETLFGDIRQLLSEIRQDPGAGDEAHSGVDFELQAFDGEGRGGCPDGIDCVEPAIRTLKEFFVRQDERIHAERPALQAFLSSLEQLMKEYEGISGNFIATREQIREGQNQLVVKFTQFTQQTREQFDPNDLMGQYDTFKNSQNTMVDNLDLHRRRLGQQYDRTQEDLHKLQQFSRTPGREAVSRAFADYDRLRAEHERLMRAYESDIRRMRELNRRRQRQNDMVMDELSRIAGRDLSILMQDRAYAQDRADDLLEERKIAEQKARRQMQDVDRKVDQLRHQERLQEQN